jgi:hypothetical protein
MCLFRYLSFPKWVLLTPHQISILSSDDSTLLSYYKTLFLQAKICRTDFLNQNFKNLRRLEKEEWEKKLDDGR